MKLAARIFLLVTGVVLLAYYLPSFYDLIAAKSIPRPSFNYSPVENHIVVYRRDDGGTRYYDLEGNEFTREQMMRLRPLANFAQLMRDGEMPRELHGVELKRSAILMNRSDLRITPRFFENGLVPLRPLLEADSGKVNLEMPDDFLRIGKRFEFVDAGANAVNHSKSRRFNEALEGAGFVFPVARFASNPTTRKVFDDGMFLLDSAGELFRLRMVKGGPEVRKLREGATPEQEVLWDNLQPLLIDVKEQLNREIRATIVERDHRVWLLVGDDFRLVELPVTSYRWDTSRLTLRGNLLNLVFAVYNPDSIETVVLDREFSLIASHIEALPPVTDYLHVFIKRILFPLEVNFKDVSSSFIRVYPTFGLPHASIVNAAILLLFLAFRRWSPWIKRSDWLDVLVIFLFGIIGLIVVFSIPPITRGKPVPSTALS